MCILVLLNRFSGFLRRRKFFYFYLISPRAFMFCRGLMFRGHPLPAGVLTQPQITFVACHSNTGVVHSIILKQEGKKSLRY